MNDWPWPVVLVLVLPAAVGHLCHFVLLINVMSGLGYPEPFMDRVRFCIFARSGLSSAVLLWMHLRDPFWTWPWPLFGYAILCVISGVIVLPLTSLYLALANRPMGSRAEPERSIWRLRNRQPPSSDPGRRSWLLRLPGHDSFRLCLREWEVTVPGLPSSLDGLQIVQLSDFHFAPCFNRRFLRVGRRCLPVWSADLILVTGDLVEDDDAIEWIEPVLGPLEARLGKFAVLGNHDQEHQPGDVMRELTRAGFVVLEGRWVTIDAGEGIIAIGGTLRSLGARDRSAHDAARSASHASEPFARSLLQGAGLGSRPHVLWATITADRSGCRWVGAVFMPSLYSRRFDRGFFRDEQTLLYVNEGIAGMHPVRYGCPPEISRFVLRTGAAQSADQALA